MKTLKLIILFTLLATVVLTQQAGAIVPFHGISFLKGAESPVTVGDPYQAAFQISNTVDTAHDTLVVTALVDVVHASGGDVNSGNILTTLNWTFSDNSNHMVGSTMVLPFGITATSNLFSDYNTVVGDFFLDNHVLVDTAVIIWHDTCNGTSTNCNTLNRTTDTVSQADVNAPLPCVSVKKTADCDVVEPNALVTYTITVKNCGPNPLTLSSISDTLLGNITSEAGSCSSLDVNQQCSFDVNYTVKAGDPSPLKNTVTVNYIDDFNQATDANASASVTVIHPNFTVVKSCTSNPIPPGGPATFNVAIHNTGDVDLSFTTNEAGLSDTNEPFTIAKGATKNITITAPADDNDVTDTITVDANVNVTTPSTCQIPDIVKESNPATCFAKPTIDVNKTADCNVAMPGKTITYTITIKNNGVNTLTLVSVSDSLLGNLTSTANSHGCGTLAAGASCSFTVQRAIAAGDPNVVDNTVDVNYVDGQGIHATDNASVSVKVIHPNFTVTKSCINDPIPVGDTNATFNVAIHNTGDVPLSFVTDENGVSSLTEPFTVAPGVTQNLTITLPFTGIDVLNTINVTGSLTTKLQCPIAPITKSDSNVCHAPKIGLTRTWGFWAQHCDFTKRVFICGHQDVNLGWINIVWTANGSNIAKLYGIFRAHDDMKGCPLPKKGTELCGVRIQASVQAIAAILNSRMSNGAALPVSEATIASILRGSDIDAIKELASLLTAFNESNDTGTALDCNGKAQGKADGGCAKRLGNCAAILPSCGTIFP